MDPHKENNNEIQTKPEINTHLVLSIIALCLTPLLGFFAIPAAAAALIFSLKAESDIADHRFDDAQRSAKYAKILGWTAIALFAIPWILIIIGFFIVAAGVGLAL